MIVLKKGTKMSADNRLVEYFLVAGVDSSTNKGNKSENKGAGTSSASLAPPTSPLTAAVTEGEDGKSVAAAFVFVCVCVCVCV